MPDLMVDIAFLVTMTLMLAYKKKFTFIYDYTALSFHARISVALSALTCLAPPFRQHTPRLIADRQEAYCRMPRRRLLIVVVGVAHHSLIRLSGTLRISRQPHSGRYAYAYFPKSSDDIAAFIV